MTQELSDEAYCKILSGKQKFFEERADRQRLGYRLLKIVAIGVGAIVPALAGLSAPPAVTAIAAIIAAFATAFDAWFKPGEMWRHNRQFQYELEHLLRSYNRPRQADHVIDLFEEGEDILKREFESFWAIRPGSEQKHQSDASKSP